MRISTAAVTGVAGVATAALALSMTTAATAGPATTVGAAKVVSAEPPTPGPTGTNRVIGLTDEGAMVAFDYATPTKQKSLGPVTGLVGDTSLVGIDYRPKDGKLYGVGNEGGVYTFVKAAGTKVSQISVDLNGENFGVDFNPAADRLRVVSDTGQSLRHDVTQAAPTTNVDGQLTYTPPPATSTPATGITGAAYTNNDNDADNGTTLFDLDTTTDQVALQSPANSGILVPTGKLGVDAGSAAGFDIVSGLVDGQTVVNTGYATLSVGDKYGFYQVDPLNGQAKRIGNFASSSQVVDIALKLQK